MDIKRLKVPSFAVLGLLGSTDDGEGFVQRLWQHLNERFHEIKQFALKDEDDHYIGLWGLMSHFNMDFMPWEGFKEGYYLAGVEVDINTQDIEGYTKWIYPGCEYVVVRVEGEYQESMAKGLDYLKEHNLTLAAAIVDFMDPKENGQPYIYFPIKKIEK